MEKDFCLMFVWIGVLKFDLIVLILYYVDGV